MFRKLILASSITLMAGAASAENIVVVPTAGQPDAFASNGTVNRDSNTLTAGETNYVTPGEPRARASDGTINSDSDRLDAEKTNTVTIGEPHARRSDGTINDDSDLLEANKVN